MVSGTNSKTVKTWYGFLGSPRRMNADTASAAIARAPDREIATIQELRRSVAARIRPTTPAAPVKRKPRMPPTTAIRPNTRSAVFWGPVVLAVGSGTIETSKYAPTWAIKSAKQASTESHRTMDRTIADMVSLRWRNVHPATAAIGLPIEP